MFCLHCQCRLQRVLKRSVHPPLPREFQLIGVFTQNPHTPSILAFLGAAPCQHAASGFLPPPSSAICITSSPSYWSRTGGSVCFFAQPHDSSKTLKIPSFGYLETLSGLAQPNLHRAAEL